MDFKNMIKGRAKKFMRNATASRQELHPQVGARAVPNLPVAEQYGTRGQPEHGDPGWRDTTYQADSASDERNPPGTSRRPHPEQNHRDREPGKLHRQDESTFGREQWDDKRRQDEKLRKEQTRRDNTTTHGRGRGAGRRDPELQDESPARNRHSRDNAYPRRRPQSTIPRSQSSSPTKPGDGVRVPSQGPRPSTSGSDRGGPRAVPKHDVGNRDERRPTSVGKGALATTAVQLDPAESQIANEYGPIQGWISQHTSGLLSSASESFRRNDFKEAKTPIPPSEQRSEHAQPDDEEDPLRDQTTQRYRRATAEDFSDASRRVRQSPNHATQETDGREKELEETLKFILSHTKSRSTSLGANDISDRINRDGIKRADRTVEMMFQFYDSRHERVAQDHEAKVTAAISNAKKGWMASFTEKMDHLHAKNNQLTDDLESLKEQRDGLRQQISDKEMAEKHMDFEMRGLRGHLVDKDRQIGTQRKDLEAWASNHQSAVSRAVEDALGVASDAHSAEKTKLSLEFEGRITRLQFDKNALGKTFEDAQKTHKQELETRDAQHRNKVQRHSEEVTRLRGEAAEALKNAASREKDLVASFESERAKLEELHEDDLDDLEQKLDYFRTVVADRDRSKPLADSDIAKLFGKLALLVDQLTSRIQWDAKLEKTWPYRDRALREPKSGMQLQKLVIQQMAWVVLEKRIFGSPFRVLSQTGTAVEKAWMSTFGDNNPSEWPRPTPRSEQWRYVTVREWLDSLEPGRQSTAKQAWVEDYESTLDSTTEELLDVVHQVSDMDRDSRTVKQVKDIVRHAAMFWLKMGSQRCRIRVLLPNMGDSGGEYLPASLVAKPELRRTGNFLGLDLDGTDEIVAECYPDIFEVGST